MATSISVPRLITVNSKPAGCCWFHEKSADSLYSAPPSDSFPGPPFVPDVTLHPFLAPTSDPLVLPTIYFPYRECFDKRVNGCCLHVSPPTALGTTYPPGQRPTTHRRRRRRWRHHSPVTAAPFPGTKQNQPTRLRLLVKKE